MSSLLARLIPAPRLRTVALAALFGFSTFAVQATPTEVPLPRPEALAPQPVAALGCASEPVFTGHITSSSGSTALLAETTTGNVFGYISDVVDDWSCTAYYRYDGLAWSRADGEGVFDWGAIIHSTTVPCNWVIGETNYLKANDTTDCADSDAEYAMPVALVANSTGTLLQGIWHADNSPDELGDFMFIHSDCTSYYEGSGMSGERVRYQVPFGSGEVTNRPGDNCDPTVIDGTGTSQTIVVDNTDPSINFDWPVAGGPALVTSAFAGVKFDATDALAGFGGSDDWDLVRETATWNGSACTGWGADGTIGASTSGTTSALDQVVSQGLLDNTCNRWTLTARDENGNVAGPITSGSIRTDLSGNLGQQSQHTFESWDLGAGDSLAVNVGTGNLVIDHPIVELPIRGTSVGLNLTYNRHDTTNVGMGPGWRLDAFRRLTVNGDGTVLFTDGDGGRHTFDDISTVGGITTYTRPPTVYAALTRDTNATPDRFTLSYRDQSVDLFDELVSGTGFLVREQDRHGNGVDFAYVGSELRTITDAAPSPDRVIDLTWSSGKVTKIEDWAYVDGSGVVQTSATGSRRATRFFYDGSDRLMGWADPLNTSDSCSSGNASPASHITCLIYQTAGLDITKTQTVTTLSGSLGTTTLTGATAVTTKVTFANLDVTKVQDAQEVANVSTGTVLSHTAPFQTQVVRKGTPSQSADTTTRYTLGSASDAHARIASLARKLGAAWITTATTWDASYPIEVATVTEDSGGGLARTTTTTYVGSSLGLVAKVVEPLTATDDRWTEYVYNANNDVTQKTVSLEGLTTPAPTITRYCYTTSGCSTSATDLLLRSTIENYVDGAHGGTDGHVEDIVTDYQYDAYGQRTREVRHNYEDGSGTALDERETGFVFDVNGNQTATIDNYDDGTVTAGTTDTVPPTGTSERTDLTSAFTYDTAGNRVSTADPRRAIAGAATTHARDAFGRTVADGWGTADTGGSWSSTTSDHDVGGSVGTISLTSNTNRNAYLTSVSAQDAEILFKVKVDRLAVGSDHLFWAYLRRQDSDNYYQVRVTFNTTQKLTTTFTRTASGTSTVIEAATSTVPHATSDWYWVRARVSGTTSVRGQIRLWKDGTTEPVTWAVDEADASPPAGLQGSGHVGLRFQLGGSYSGSYPVVASVDELTVTSLGGGGQSLAADDYIERTTYDALDQALTVETPTTPGVTIAQKTSTTVYDEFGSARHATDFGGVISATEFDRTGRPTKTFEDSPGEAAAVTSETTYDPSGRTLSDKDRRQVAGGLGATLHAYDELGRQVAVAAAEGTSYESEDVTTYDTLGRVTAVEIGVDSPGNPSPSSQKTIYTFDKGGRVTQTDAGSTCGSATYDYRDLPQTVTEGLVGVTCASGADTRTTTNRYDALGRLYEAEITAGPNDDDKPTIETFDSVGNKLSTGALKSGVTTTTDYTIDDLDQVVVEVRAGSTTKTSYDASGNAVDSCFWQSGTAGDCYPVGTLPWTNMPTQSTSTTYDARDQRIGLVDSVSNQTTVYDADHNYQVKAIYLPTNADLTKELQTLSTYDDRHRLIEIKHQLCTISAGHACSSATTVGEADYGYDDTDNRTQVVENNGSVTKDFRYCYDPLERVEYRNEAAACGSAGSSHDEKYVYDDTGNRTKTEIGPSGSVVSTDFAYDAEGRLCKTSATSCATPNVTYDTNGRTKTWNGWTFTYDPDGRMLSACKSATCATTHDKVAFTYDGEGHRTRVVSDPAGTGGVGSGQTPTTWDFRYQDDAIVDERLTDDTHTAALVRSYVVDDSGTVVRMTVAAGEPGAGDYVPVWNGHGDAVNLSRLNADGTLTLANSYRYDTWGKPTTATHNSIPDLGFRFTYVGEFDVQWDDQLGLGLLYMHARHYSPALGRFVQPDPDRSEANLYAYAANNPVTEMDPDGTCFIVCGVIGAVVSVAIYAATTDNFDIGEAVKEGAIGGVLGMTGVGLISKVASVGKLLSKVPKASRALSRVGPRVRQAASKAATQTRGAVKKVANKICHNDYVRVCKGWVANKHVKPRYWPKGTGIEGGQRIRRIAIGSDKVGRVTPIRGHIHRANIMEGAFGRYGWFQRFRFPRKIVFLPGIRAYDR